MAIRVCIYRFAQSWQARVNDPSRFGAYFNKTIAAGRTAEEVQQNVKAWSQGKEVELSYFDATQGQGDFSEGHARR